LKVGDLSQTLANIHTSITMKKEHSTLAYSHGLRLVFRKQRRQRNLAMSAIVLDIMSTIALTASVALMTLAAPNMAATVFEKCTGGHRIAYVIDGDTLWIDGTKVRVADIDAPEISEPKCASELALGNRAIDRTGQPRSVRNSSVAGS